MSPRHQQSCATPDLVRPPVFSRPTSPVVTNLLFLRRLLRRVVLLSGDSGSVNHSQFWEPVTLSKRFPTLLKVRTKTFPDTATAANFSWNDAIQLHLWIPVYTCLGQHTALLRHLGSLFCDIPMVWAYNSSWGGNGRYPISCEIRRTIRPRNISCAF